MRIFATRQFDYRVAAAVGCCCIGLGWLAERALLGGGTRGLVVAGAAVLLPLLTLISWRRPLLFPFCAYVALVPFDNLLATGLGDTVTKLLAIVTGVALLLRVAITRKATVPSQSVLAWLALVIWMAATIFWALDQSAAIEQFTRYAQLFLFLAVVAIYPAELRDVRMGIYATIAGACAAVAFGWYLFVTGTGNFDSRLYVTAGSAHIDPNHFAASLLMPLALAAMLALRAPTWLGKTLAFIPVAMLLAGVYMSESRGAFVATGAMLAFFAIVSRYRVQAIVVGVLSVAALPAAFVARMQVAAASGGNGRVEIWHSALAAFKSYWLLGAGIGNFPTAYDSVFLQVPHDIFFSWHIQAHDLLAQTAVELGVLGIVLMFGAWFLQFRDARMLQPLEGFEDLAIALQAGIIGLFVSSFFLDIMWSKYTWLAFVLVALARSAILKRSHAHTHLREVSS